MKKFISTKAMKNLLFRRIYTSIMLNGVLFRVSTLRSVRLIPSQGHTAGHVSVRIASNSEEALITGDFIHHPCQLAHPEWASPVDFDQSQSTATRQRLFAELAGTPTLIIGSHFADPSAGHIVRAGSAYRLDI